MKRIRIVLLVLILIGVIFKTDVFVVSAETALPHGVLQSSGIDVRAFGAKGDGVADDTSAIQAAINYAAANVSGTWGNEKGGDIVFLPAGVYKVTDSIMMKKCVALMGAGMARTIIDGSSIRYDGVTRKAVITTSNDSVNQNNDIIIEDLEIQSNRDTTGIEINYGTLMTRIERVKVKPAYIGISAPNSWTVKVRDCVIDSCDYGFFGTFNHNLNIADSRIHRCRIGISVTSSHVPVIERNVIQWTDEYAVYFNNCSSPIIKDNYFEWNVKKASEDSSVIFIDFTNGTPKFINVIVVIDGNFIANGLDPASYNTSHGNGIRIKFAHSVRITSNIVDTWYSGYLPLKRGIWLESAVKNAIIEGNRLSGEFAIKTDGKDTALTLSANDIINGIVSGGVQIRGQ